MAINANPPATICCVVPPMTINIPNSVTPPHIDSDIVMLPSDSFFSMMLTSPIHFAHIRFYRC